MGNTPKKYIPISCNFYDYLEAFGTLKKNVKIEFEAKSGEILVLQDVIQDLKIIDGAEFMILRGGDMVRLDRIISVDDIFIKDFPC